MKGRPLEHSEPDLLWDFRRGKALIDVLALVDPVRRQSLVKLAIEWDVVSDVAYLFEFSTIEIAHRLAKHVQEHYREQASKPEDGKRWGDWE